MTEQLLIEMGTSLEYLKDTIDKIKMYHLEHTQDALNWIDKINKLSVEF